MTWIHAPREQGENEDEEGHSYTRQSFVGVSRAWRTAEGLLLPSVPGCSGCRQEWREATGSLVMIIRSTVS